MFSTVDTAKFCNKVTNAESVRKSSAQPSAAAAGPVSPLWPLTDLYITAGHNSLAENASPYYPTVCSHCMIRAGAWQDALWQLLLQPTATLELCLGQHATHEYPQQEGRPLALLASSLIHGEATQTTTVKTPDGAMLQHNVCKQAD